MDSGTRLPGFKFPALLLTRCMTLCKLNFSILQFPHLKNGNKNNTHMQAKLLRKRDIKVSTSERAVGVCDVRSLRADL